MLSLKERYGIGNLGAFLFLSASLGFAFFSFLAVETRLNRILTINIPLYTEFPIPIVFWCGVFVYLFVVSLLLKADFKKMIWPGILLGFCVHFVLLILDLNIRNVKGEIGWFSNIYSLYFMFVLYAVMSLLSVWAGVLSRLICSKADVNNPAALLYSIPFVFFYSCVTVFLYGNYILSSLMLIIFLSAFYLKAKEGICAILGRYGRSFFIMIFDEKVFLPLVFIVSMFFRVIFLKRIMTNPDFINTASDGGFLDNLARNFLAGKPATFPGSRGYWMFLAGIYAIFGSDYFKVGVIQSIFGSAAVILTYLIAKRGFGVIPARIAAIAAALDYPLIFSAVGLGHEAMDIFYGVLIVYLLIKCRDFGLSAKGITALALTGASCAVAMATREVNMLMPLVGTIWLVYSFSKSNLPKIKITFAVFILLLFSILAISPFLYLNYKSFGSVYEQSSTYGIKNVLEQYNPQLTAIGFNPFADFTKSMHIITGKPLVFLKAAWSNYYSKFMDLYFSQGYGGFDPVFLVRKPTTNYYLSMWFYAYLSALAGFVCVLRSKFKDKAVVLLVLSIIAYKTAFHLFTIAVYRYRAAIEPFIIMFAAWAVYAFVRLALNGLKNEVNK